jgi:hypothetical protein
MASIYKNAFLTIASTKYKEGAEGCSTTTSPEFIAISVPNTNIYVRKQLPQFPKLEEHPRELWYRTVLEYSGMQLTFEKERQNGCPSSSHSEEGDFERGWSVLSRASGEDSAAWFFMEGVAKSGYWTVSNLPRSYIVLDVCPISGYMGL